MEYLQNPRRSPRAPARCRTAVVSAHGTFEATTEDIGGHGCQLVSPRLVRKGEPVQLVVSHEAMKEPLRIAGRVAWASEQSPWRLGIAYDGTALGKSQHWFDALLTHAPGLTAFRRIPERIPIDAAVYLATPPRFLVDFTPDEVALLRSVGSGTSVAELRALLRDRWAQVQRALFSLLAHQHLTLTRGGSVHPDAWRKILSEAESSLAVESLRSAPVPDLTPAPNPLRPGSPTPAPSRTSPVWPVAPVAPARPPPPSPATRPTIAAVPAAAPQAGPAARAQPAPEAPADWLVSAAEMMPLAWPSPSPPPAAPAATGEPRGVTRGIDDGASWRTTPPPPAGASQPRPRVRSQDAQGCYEQALAELEAGRMAAALALLRRALVLAPGDAEISGAMARVMRGG